MKISVITVAFNAVDTIADAIRSVQAQSHDNIEHIIIDGNSNDGTQSVIKEVAISKTLFISEPDRGLYDAMNKGIYYATGDIVGILNADDYFASESALAQVAVEFSHHREVEAVLGDIAFVDEQQAITRRYDSGRFKPDRTRWGLMPAHPGMYMKRSAYKQIGPYRIDMKIAADFDFVVRAFTCERLPFVHLPEVLVHMRPGGASTESWKSRLTINREVVQACRDNGVYTNLAMVMSKYPLKILELIR